MDRLMIATSKIPGVKVWRQNVGTRVFLDPETGLRRVFRTGLPKGAADLGGIFGPSGRVLQIETKAPKKTQSKAQIRWESMIRKHGGLYLLATQHKDLDAETSARQWAGELQRQLGL